MAKQFFIRSVFATLSILLLTSAGPSRAKSEPITVFAAASLKDTLEAVGKVYTDMGGSEIRFSFASSSVLAKQIEAGSIADIYASSDLKWMDYLEKKKLIKRDTRINLLGNRLVLVAPFGAPLGKLDLQLDVILHALGNGRISTGDTSSVPAGVYAKAALQTLNLWDTLQSRLAQSDNVRSALAFVTRKEAPLGIVYETDARAEKGVKIVAVFPETSHEPIIYPFAITASSTHRESEKFVAFLKSETATKIFRNAGFPIIE
jgi:molybdate transport system substrate-binding protein